jgi:two-component system CheB/CheR fusion protein
VLKDHAPLSREIESGTGTWFLRRILPYRTDDDRVEGVVITFSDISELKVAERNIRAAQAYSDSIVETIRQPLVVLDDELRIISASRAFYEAFEAKREAAVGRPIGTAGALQFREPGLRVFLDRIRAGEENIEDFEIELDLPPFSGRRSLLMSAREIVGPSAGRKILITIDDITERKRLSRVLEAAKLQAERANLGKSRFLAAASHDLRQPLQTLTLLRGILSKSIKDENALALVRKLDEPLQVMSGMLNTLLDINQLEAGIVNPEIVVFSVDTLFDRLKTEFSYHVAAKELDWRVVGSGLHIRSDPRLLEQMIRNLLWNAVKYTPYGKILLGCRRRGDKLRLEVWDTGVGIPEEHLQSIFEEFHQVDNSARDRSLGLGLGLADRTTHRRYARPRNRRPFSARQGFGLCRRGAAGTGKARSMASQGRPDRGGRRARGVGHDRRGRFHGAGDARAVVQGGGASHCIRRRWPSGAGTDGDGSGEPDIVIADYNLPGDLTDCKPSPSCAARSTGRFRQSSSPATSRPEHCTRSHTSVVRISTSLPTPKS